MGTNVQEIMKKRFLTTMVVGLAGLQGVVWGVESRPKLVVGIVVDQLRTDYLESLRDMLGTGGFRRLMETGVYLKDVDFKVEGGDATSATSIIQTGAYPRQTGITGAMILDPSTKTLQQIFSDESYIGNFTDEKYSPAALRVTTLTDALAIEENGKSRIHSIAPNPGEAIILAGHAGNSAFWVNDESGRWSSTTYYTDIPNILQEKNYITPLISRLDTIQWKPLKTGVAYPYVSQQETNSGFKYTFSRSDRDVFNLYKQTPLINSEITDSALEYIQNLNLGKNDGGTDVLNLAFTLAPYSLATNEGYRYELEDAYLRLDQDLEKLFNALDQNAGKQNILIYLVSTGYFSEPAINNQELRIPGGTFSVKRAMSLLGAYLSAKYGNGSYVDHYANGQVYLSAKTLEEKGLDLDKIAEESRDFLVRMSGVADAYTIADLVSPAIEELEAHRLAIDPKISGDVILEFAAGWKVVDDSRFPSIEQQNKTSIYQTPGFIMGNGIEAKTVKETVEAVAIAPTITNALRIRAPNAARAKPLSLTD